MTSFAQAVSAGHCLVTVVVMPGEICVGFDSLGTVMLMIVSVQLSVQPGGIGMVDTPGVGRDLYTY